MEGERTLGQQMLALVDRPRDAFAQIARQPGRGWVVPLLILLVGTAVLQVVAAPYAAAAAREALDRQMSSLPPAQAEMVSAQAGRFATPLLVGAMGWLGGVVGTAFGILLGAGILYFLALVSGGEGEFGPALGATLWAWTPFGLRPLVQAAVVAVQRGLIVNQGLSYLVSAGDPLKDARNVAYVLLSQVDLFSLWHLVLVYAASQALFRFGRNKAALVTVLYAAINLLFRAGTVVIQAMLVPMS
ncbi:MAG: YIP1 family protein [Anaerolineae bacterium]